MEPNTDAASEAQRVEAMRKELKPAGVRPEELARLGALRWGLRRVRVERELDSYDDRNYLIQAEAAVESNTVADTTRFVVKFHNGVDSANEAFIRAQMAALKRVKGSVMCPVDEGEGTVEELGSRKHFVRLLRYVEGDLLYDAMKACSQEEARVSLLRDVGSMLGKADNALRGLEAEHPSVIRAHMWDLQQFDRIEFFVSFIPDVEKVSLIKDVIQAYNGIKSSLPGLPKSVIQGDGNDRNIVICSDGAPALLDFGDMVYSYTIGELAIALAYCIVGFFTDCDEESAQGDSTWLNRCSGLVSGYFVEHEATKDECNVLYEFAWARLATSACIGAYSISKDPANEYLLVHSQPAWRSLRALKRVGKAAFLRAVIPETKPSAV